MELQPNLAIRSSGGVELWKQASNIYQPNEAFVHDESKHCRSYAFSPDAKYFAWVNGQNVQICEYDWKVVTVIPQPKVFYMKFSPKSTYLTTWEIYAVSVSDPEPKPNLHVFKSATGELIYSAIQKRAKIWEPFWSHDESMFAAMIGGEVLFFDCNGPDGYRKAVKRAGVSQNGSFSLSPNSNVALYTPGTKGAPSTCKLFRYPNLEQAISQKSFFQSDNIEITWNKKGNAVLLLTSTEVDTTGVSYYGKQALHFLTIKGDACTMTLKAEGPIHAVAWSPKSTEFCVCYGFMPAHATLFNLKGDAIFEFETGIRNSIYYNDFGSLLLFGGFGNLGGNLEVWDCVKRQKLSETMARDTTLLAWSPTGDKYFTATTAPRLRIGNGFKIWHYSGALLCEQLWTEGQELLEVVWQTLPSDKLKEPVITGEKVEGIQSIQKEASKQKYVPPCIRDKLVPGSNNNTSFTQQKRLPPGMTLMPDNNQAKKGQRNNRTRNRHPKIDNESNTEAGDRQQNQKSQPKPENGNDLEIGKRAKMINSKLKDIKKLKEKVERGEKLDHNQTAKVATEVELVKELASLKV